MPYQYQYVDEVALPVGNPQQDHSPVAANNGYADSIGGYFDVYGDEIATPQRQNIPVSGVLVGDTEYLVDETGDGLVDETGDTLIAGDDETMLRTQIVAIREKVRRQCTLWRVWLEDETVRQWKTVRFARMSQPQVVTDRDFKAEVTCDFESAMPYWHAETVTTVAVSTTSGIPASLILDNGGETVDDATITITRTSGTITAVALVCSELGISMAWTGSLTSGDVLVIDAGAQSVQENGDGAYSGFSLATAHTATRWLPITAGTHALVVTTTGGAASVSISFYVQVA